MRARLRSCRIGSRRGPSMKNIGPLSRSRAPHCQRWWIRNGSRIPLITLFSLDWKRKDGNRLRRPRHRCWLAACRLISLVCLHRWTWFEPMVMNRQIGLMSNSSIGFWLRSDTENGWPWSGWMRLGMRIPMGSRRMPPVAIGLGGIGLSSLTTTTCPSINSQSNNLPAT